MIIVKCEIVVVSSGGTLKADSEAAFRGEVASFKPEASI
jgi:hypothetical protein